MPVLSLQYAVEGSIDAVQISRKKSIGCIVMHWKLSGTFLADNQP